LPTGIILLDKPRGLSSNGALQRVRKAYRAASAGHVGTLDPMATGMLPVCLDEATKVIAEIESGAKCYEFTVQLGSRTDTGDAEGQVVERQPIPPLDTARVEAALTGFRGVIRQVPPMYSALKRDGRPLYELARQGLEVERAARAIEIRQLEVVALGADTLRLVCECAKGTYIRVLGEDIARTLDTCGHLTYLRRLWVEPFRLASMVTLDSVLEGAGRHEHLLAPDIALQALPESRLTDEQVSHLRRGQALEEGSFMVEGELPARRVRVYGPQGAFLGLAEPLPDGRLQPRRLLQTTSAKPML
jgi:tRNA pseudouridine55 synthase